MAGPILDRRLFVGGMTAGLAAFAKVHAESGAVVLRDVPAAMRDGTILRADVYRPDGEGPFPAVVQRTPYDKSNFARLGQLFAARGFLTVIQDVRGQFASDGRFEPWIHEGEDGYDTIEWTARLDDATAMVGTMGASYSGACQMQAAVLQPPHLRAMITQVTPTDYFDQWVYPGGAFALSFNQSWLLRNVARSAAAKLPDGAAVQARMDQDRARLAEHWYGHLPLNDFPPLDPHRPEVAGYYFDWLNQHSRRDDYWAALSMRDKFDRIGVPVLNFGGWYDVFVSGTVELHEGLRDHGGAPTVRQSSSLVIGPWGHLDWGPKLGEVDFGPAAANPFAQMASDWFDRWLRPPVSPRRKSAANVRYFMMGANEWREAARWPPEDAREIAMFLAGSGRANGLAGDGRLTIGKPDGSAAPDQFVYDPAHPVPSLGGHGCCYSPESPMGPRDQRAVEARQDVLNYTSAPLESALAVVGPVTVALWAKSSAPDTDFTAKLVDVHPDGTAINICEGIIRARFRRSFEESHLLHDEEIAEYRIELNPTANLFNTGHRIRLEISSSNFPIYDRNPNTGLPIGSSDQIFVARQTIFHDRQHPSRIILHIVPQ